MELLAPAGNLEKLKTAIRFGADAVYCGAGSFSLRAPETSFTLDDLAEGVRFAHDRDRQVYLAMNIFPFDEDFSAMEEYFKKAVDLGIDAVILSDPGVLSLVERLAPGIKVHLSTQANTTNSESVKFWHNQGVDRIIVSRELSLERIKAMKQKVPEIELEIFIHGAMCIAYSGRCLLSKFFNDRSANRGLCSQPCRWEYAIREAGRPEEQVIHEDERGTYILNSRDLCLIEHIPELAFAGIDSLKIEGRMKSAYYVAAVTRVYRAALDHYKNVGEGLVVKKDWLEELNKVSHRPYTTGFYLPEKEDETEYVTSASNIRSYDFVGITGEPDVSGKNLHIKARNRFAVDDLLEVLDHNSSEVLSFKVGTIKDSKTGAYLKEAHNSYLVMVTPAGKLIPPVSEESIVRKKRC